MKLKRDLLGFYDCVGSVRFLDFDSFVYKYENDKRTDKVIGFKINVLSDKQRQSFVLKVMNSDIDFINSVLDKSKELYLSDLAVVDGNVFEYNGVLYFRCENISFVDGVFYD